MREALLSARRDTVTHRATSDRLIKHEFDCLGLGLGLLVRPVVVGVSKGPQAI